MRRRLGHYLFVIWCVTWLPTVVGILGHGPPDAEIVHAPQERAISAGDIFRLVCLTNGLSFYVGGTVWLAGKSIRQPISKIVAIWSLFLFLNPIGPAVLAICNAMIDDTIFDRSELQD